MPKVFRPKLSQPTHKSLTKELPVPTKPDVELRLEPPPQTSTSQSLSPTLPPCISTPAPPSPRPSNRGILVPSHISKELEEPMVVDMDQLVAATNPVCKKSAKRCSSPIPDMQVDLFSIKSLKRNHPKALSQCNGAPIPPRDQPLDRSSVPLRSLLRWTPVNKPPPSYRKDRSTSKTPKTCKQDDTDSSVCSTPSFEQAVKPLIDEPPSPPVVDILAPQLRLDADGNIVLDETSLSVSVPTRNDADLKHVTEDTGILSVNYSSFRSPYVRCARWNASETVRFYRALSTIGPDFYLMEGLFPNRSRSELKRKFKRESRANPYLVNQALRNRRTYDLTALIPVSDEEGEENADDDNSKSNQSKPVRIKNELKRDSIQNPLSMKPPVRLKVQKPRKQKTPTDLNKIDQTIDAVLCELHKELEPSTSSTGGHEQTRTRTQLEEMISYMQQKQQEQFDQQLHRESIKQSPSHSLEPTENIPLSEYSIVNLDSLKACEKIDAILFAP